MDTENKTVFCYKCGTEVLNDSDFCTNCGAEIIKEAKNEKRKNTVNKKTKVWLIVIACVIVLMGSIFSIHQAKKAELKKQLMRDWSRIEGTGTNLYTLELDFSEDEIEYIFDSFYFEDTIATFDYKIVSGNKIKVDDSDTIYTIEFNDEKSMITITPALTSSDSSENWFNHDD